MKNLIVTVLFLLFAYCSFSQTQQLSSSAAAPVYEFRGVWIATVDNIDWPQRNQFNVDSQKA
ncbi:MAG TPA: hypothetical protein VFZ78_04280, partial [Flavisolibacter sp.]